MAPTKEISTITGPAITDADVANLSSMADALAALGGDVVSTFSESGEWDVLEDKAHLVGVPFVGLRWRFNAGDAGEFVSLEVITEDGRRLIINDGSTGIYRQLKRLTDETGRTTGIACKKGLRRSDYTYTDEKGESRPATTFYLS